MLTTDIPSAKKQKAIIFFTVFIYLLGFGIIIPILPLLSTQMGATALQTGLLLSIYSLMQFIFSPVWGKLSDRYGRRPILLICLAGEVGAYMIFAQARTLEWLFIARILSGFFGASISTANAYISDITPPNQRSKGMALIGAAFGLGFLFGPALGGGMSVLSELFSSDPFFKTSFSSYVVSGLCALTFVFAWLFLTETRKTTSPASTNNRWQQILKFFKLPVVGPLIFIFMLSSLAMSAMEAALVLFMQKKFGWGIKEVSFGFAYIGIIIALSQGFLVRKLIPKIGEKHMLRLGLTLMSMGLSGIALAQSVPMMAVTQTLLAFGYSFTNPSVLGAISLLTDSNEQGAALGTTQSMASLGRILGPALGGALFGALTPESPFIMSGLMTLLALFVVITIFKSIPDTGKTVTLSPKKEETHA